MKKRFEFPFNVLAVVLAAVLVVAVGAARSNQAQASRYYPQAPAKLTSPEMALQAATHLVFQRPIAMRESHLIIEPFADPMQPKERL